MNTRPTFLRYDDDGGVEIVYTDPRADVPTRAAIALCTLNPLARRR